MKFFENKFKDQYIITNKSIFKKIGCFVCVIGIFFFTFAMLSYYTSPNRLTAKGAITQNFAVVESEGGTYYGPLNNALYLGEGAFRHLDGSVYEGDFSNSKRNGKGTLTWINGDKFTGTWTNDQMTEGTYTFADGRTYTGTFKDNKWDKGTFTLGPALNKFGFTEFSADIANGVVSALVFTMPDGTTYNGAVDGQAKIKYASGNTYDGTVLSAKRSGDGAFHWTNGASYNGKWNNDLMEGKGAYYYSADHYPYIEGNFKNGKLEGMATYYKSSDKSFKTQWSNGVCTNNNVN